MTDALGMIYCTWKFIYCTLRWYGKS